MVYRFERFTATFDPDGVLIEHRNGGKVRVPLVQLGNWLNRMFRKLL